MNKRKPQITITETERLALAYCLGLLKTKEKSGSPDYQVVASPIIQHLLDRSKRDE